MKCSGVLLAFATAICGCHRPAATAEVMAPETLRINRERVVHVFVALCDNKFQGIQPVPKRIGNGDDPASNLYWGCDLGTYSYFLRHKDWREVKVSAQPKKQILARAVFQHRRTGAFMVADAYQGREIKRCAEDFLRAAAGNSLGSLKLATGKEIHLGGSAKLVAFIGHNVKMDVGIASAAYKTGSGQRDAVVLACRSTDFRADLRRAGVARQVLTTGLMAPEAYSLAALLDGWLRNEPPASWAKRAASAYANYQKCGIRAANRLFTGR